MKIVVTGGAGFIGSAVIRHLIDNTDHTVLNLDKLTYAANLASLESVSENSRYQFVQADIGDGPKVTQILEQFQPDRVVNLAAESHVDRSIDGPGAFIQTNMVGTFTLLQQVLGYWRGLSGERADGFRFHHVSTDEVFGSLGADGLFTETSPYQPNSPYSASKAASDHLVRAWQETYGLPTVLTNCSNNYGPFQFPEKLIPLMIIKGLAGEPMPVYGRGENIRDWLHVEDHARALCLAMQSGAPGQCYNIGGDCEMANIDVVRSICALLDELAPAKNDRPHDELIDFVQDRPGHDLRYAVDAGKIERDLGWRPDETFASGLRQTVTWYLANRDWWQQILDGQYAGERLGRG